MIWNINLTVFIAFIFLVLINALEDGFRFRGSKFKANPNFKVYAHIGNSLHILGWIFMMNFEFSWLFLIQYVLIRFALFDSIWNIMIGLPIFFTGTTSLYGMFWEWFEKKTGWQSVHILFWLKLFSLLIAISFINYNLFA